MLQMACEQSLAESPERQIQVDEARCKVASRLEDLGLQRLDTKACGNCMFIAISFSAGVALDHDDLRQAVCNHVRTMEDTFKDLIEVRFPDYASYVDHMSRDGSWGGERVLQSCAALFMRPVRVVSAESEEHEGIREFLPPQCVASDAWGPPITWSHFEATCPLAEDSPNGEAPQRTVKMERS
jgi:hypothetical protein